MRGGPAPKNVVTLLGGWSDNWGKEYAINHHWSMKDPLCVAIAELAATRSRTNLRLDLGLKFGFGLRLRICGGGRLRFRAQIINSGINKEHLVRQCPAVGEIHADCVETQA